MADNKQKEIEDEYLTRVSWMTVKILLYKLTMVVPLTLKYCNRTCSATSRFMA